MAIIMGRFESLNFDFCVINFDTMKLIFSAKVSETLMTQDFRDIEKERKLQYQWYHNFRSYMVERDAPNPNCRGSDKISMVEARGIEPLSENSSSRLSPSADGLLKFPRAYAVRQAYALGIPIVHDRLRGIRRCTFTANRRPR